MPDGLNHVWARAVARILFPPALRNPGQLRAGGKSQSSGFTLAELSIVLVIIGLLAGGILVGRDMIHAAEIRATVSEIEKFNAATNTFRLKFTCLPGDCPNAVELGLGILAGPGTNGDGNGVVHADSAESLNFWYHLGKALLIQGSYSSVDPSAPWDSQYKPWVDVPGTPLRVNSVVVSYGDGVNYNELPGAVLSPMNNGFEITTTHGVTLGNDGWGGGTNRGGYALTTMESAAIDAKLDDGLPMSGRALAQSVTQDGTFNGNRPPMPPDPTHVDVGCVDYGPPAKYDTTNSSDRICNLFIRGQF